MKALNHVKQFLRYEPVTEYSFSHLIGVTFKVPDRGCRCKFANKDINSVCKMHRGDNETQEKQSA